MAFDSFDMVVPPDAGEVLCVDCATAAGWDVDDDDVRPILDLDEVPYLETCGACGAISEYGSFGPEAVDYGLDMIGQAISDNRRCDYLDAYAEHLRWCILGDHDEHETNMAQVERYLGMDS